MDTEQALATRTALDFVRGPWLLAEWQRHYGIRRVTYDGTSLTADHDGGVCYTLTLLHRETGQQVALRFYWDAGRDQWICPEAGYVVAAAAMEAAIARAMAGWENRR